MEDLRRRPGRQPLHLRNKIFFSEGPGFACSHCSHDLVQNNYAFMAAYPFGRAFQYGGLDTHYVTVRRNTIHYAASGAIAWMWCAAPRRTAPS